MISPPIAENTDDTDCHRISEGHSAATVGIPTGLIDATRKNLR